MAWLFSIVVTLCLEMQEPIYVLYVYRTFKLLYKMTNFFTNYFIELIQTVCSYIRGGY